MTVTRIDGSVVYADFGKQPARESPPLASVTCDILYQDDEVILTRTHIDFCGTGWVTHGLYPAP